MADTARGLRPLDPRATTRFGVICTRVPAPEARREVRDALAAATGVVVAQAANIALLIVYRGKIADEGIQSLPGACYVTRRASAQVEAARLGIAAGEGKAETVTMDDDERTF